MPRAATRLGRVKSQNKTMRQISRLSSPSAVAACYRSSCSSMPVACFLVLSLQDIPTH